MLILLQPFGTIAIQLAQHRGAKVISTVHSVEDKQYLERFTPSVGEFHSLITHYTEELIQNRLIFRSFSSVCHKPQTAWTPHIHM